jgi:hypothetical protein
MISVDCKPSRLSELLLHAAQLIRRADRAQGSREAPAPEAACWRASKVQSSNRPGRHDLGQRRQGDRQDDRRRDEESRQRGGDHGRGGQELSTSSRVSSPTRATSRPISSPTPRRWWPRLEAAHILIHEKKLSSLQPLVPILESIVQAGKPLLIVAEDIEGGPWRHFYRRFAAWPSRA